MHKNIHFTIQAMMVIQMKDKIKMIFGGIGIVLTVAHLVYYLYAQYYWMYFFLGFGIIWLVFVLPLKMLKK